MAWYTTDRSGRVGGIDFLAPTKIDQTASAGVTNIASDASGLVTRLHKIIITGAAQGTITIEDTDGSDLSGPMPFGANGGFVIPFESVPEGCLITPSGKGMQINTSAKVYGWAVCSQSAS